MDKKEFFVSIAVAAILFSAVSLVSSAFNDDNKSECHPLCQCAFPGQCKHKNCNCKPASGLVRPESVTNVPADRWLDYAPNPIFEGYGHEINGVRYYSKFRLKSGQGAVYMTCWACGSAQYYIYAGQRCQVCGMFLKRK